MEFSDTRKIHCLVDIFSTWGCVLTKGNHNTYKGMLMNMRGERKSAFDEVMAIHGWNPASSRTWIEFIDEVPEIRAPLHWKIQRGNRMLKADPAKFIDVLKKTSTYDYFKKQFGEVFTPLSLVNQMLDKLPAHVWSNPNLLWLDPACGSGNFLLVIKQRLMEGLRVVFPDDKERERHILENMLFGVDFQVRNCSLASMQLNPEDKYKLNLKQADSLKFSFWGRRFNTIVMNPPYQTNNDKGGSTTHASPLYNCFIEKTIDDLHPDYLLCVCPSRWMVGGRGLGKFRQRMISDRRIKSIVHFPGSFSVFGPDVELAGGVSYFFWDKYYHGECEFIVGNTSTKILLDKYDIVVFDNNARAILDKVIKITSEWMDKPWAIQTPFGLHTSFKAWRSGGVPCYSFGQSINHCDADVFTDKCGIQNKWKVAIGEANNDTNPNVFRVIAKPFLIEPGAICTQTYIIVNVFDTRKEAENFAVYVQTKFFRFMLWLRKPTQHVSKEKFAWVPDLGDYTKIWTAEELYRKFALTKQEQEYIESKIKS